MKLTVPNLLEQQSKIAAEMRTITETPEGQAQRFDALKAQNCTLEKRIERQKALDEIERRMEGAPLHGIGDQNFDRELRQFSLVRAIASQLPNSSIDAEREQEPRPDSKGDHTALPDS